MTARGLLALALAAAGCRSTYPIDVGALEHDPRDRTTIYFRDGRQEEAHTVPREDGAAWLILEPVKAERVERFEQAKAIGQTRAHRATIHLRGGDRIDGLIVDSGRGYFSSFAIVDTYPTSELIAVADTRRFSGLFSGLLLGPLATMAGGMLLGALFGAVAGNPDDPKYDGPHDFCLPFCYDSPAEEGAVAGMGIGFAAGLVIGPIVGAVRGNGTLYGELPISSVGGAVTISVVPTADGPLWGLWGTF